MSKSPIQDDNLADKNSSGNDNAAENKAAKTPKTKTASKTASKKVAKKAATKATTKTAAAKKAAKKTTAKKAAKKAPAKTDATTPSASKRAEVKEPKATPASDQAAPPVKQTMGRVEGLGAVKKEDRNQPRRDRDRDRNDRDRHRNDRDNQERDGHDNSRRNRNQGRNKQGQHKNNRNRNQGGNERGKQNQQDKQNDRQNGRQGSNRDRQPRERRPKKAIVLTGDPVKVNGMLEIAPKGFGFLRVPEKNFEQCKQDVFVTPDFIRKHGLRAGVWIHGTYQEGSRGPQLVEIESINDIAPEEAFKLPHFEELKAVNPSRRIAFETTPDRYTTRVLDIVAPVGRGQRGLIVSPPRSGKTTLLLHMAEAVREQYDESIHLIILLIDERPEEVTEFRRTLPGVEIYASSNDDPGKSHARIAELCVERAKRLVEGGTDVLILMDSITRLARSYNNGGGSKGGNNNKRGYQSGGIVAGALEAPRRIFAAARNTRTAGSLTILATALVQTNSRADEAIFQEFKGTGNMELVLDRRIAEQYIYPAVDIFKSATRREELIMADHLLHKVNLIRRGLKGHRPEEAMERLLFFLKKFPNNAQMLMEIKG